MKFAVFFSLALLCARAEEPKLADLAEFAEKQLEIWHTPGASIAVVRGEEILLVRGFGFKNLKEKALMTAKTVQPIASISKSMTVASIAVLARDGKVNWDKPVRDYIPEFQLKDEYASAHVTPRDLVTHATGLPRHDWVWVGSKASRAEFVHRLRYLEPTAEPRAKYQYNNLAYCTAGYLAGRVAGTSWEELLQERLFKPLGMETASCSITDLAKAEDHATPYRLNEQDEPVLIRYLNVDALGPAGAVNASADDMSRYLKMLINKGNFEGKEILSESDVTEMMSQKMVVADSDVFSELGSSQYGMGLRITTYRGLKMAQHSGALRGLSASLAFLPKEKLGVFCAVNCSDSSIPTILTYRVFDQLLDLEPIDWSARFKERRDKDKASRDDAEKEKISTKKEGTRPGHSLASYAGEYEHPGYGSFTVKFQEDALFGTYNQATSKFEHFHFETFQAPKNEFNSLSEQKIKFITSIDGDIESVAVQLEPTTAPIIFKRKPDASLLSEEFLKKFIGQFELGTSKGKVALRADNTLTWMVGSGSLRELEPVGGARFLMKDRPGYSLEFLQDDAGNYNRIAAHTPFGSNLGKRIGDQ